VWCLLAPTEHRPLETEKLFLLRIQRWRLYGLAAEVDRVHNLVAPLLYQPVINANTKAANVDIDLGRLVLADNLSNPTRNFHRIKAAASLRLDDAVATTPRDRTGVCAFAGGIDANDERAIRFDVLFELAKRDRW